MSKPTTAEIRERHNAEVCKLNRLPNAIGPKSRFVEAHNDCGTLLERLEAAEATIKRQQAAMNEIKQVLSGVLDQRPILDEDRSDLEHALDLAKGMSPAMIPEIKAALATDKGQRQ